MKKTRSDGTVTIKKYANRRLYNTETSAYITLDHLAQRTREGRDFRVVDAKTEGVTVGKPDSFAGIKYPELGVHPMDEEYRKFERLLLGKE